MGSDEASSSEDSASYGTRPLEEKLLSDVVDAPRDSSLDLFDKVCVELTTVLAASATTFATDLAAEDTTPNLLTTPFAPMILGLIKDVASAVMRLKEGGFCGPMNLSPFEEEDVAEEDVEVAVTGLDVPFSELLATTLAHEDRVIS